MTTKRDPLIYEHDTKEEAEAYDVWFRKKGQEGLDDSAQRAKGKVEEERKKNETMAIRADDAISVSEAAAHSRTVRRWVSTRSNERCKA